MSIREFNVSVIVDSCVLKILFLVIKNFCDYKFEDSEIVDSVSRRLEMSKGFGRCGLGIR